jgi:iron complex transport system substrate-binding protein
VDTEEINRVTGEIIGAAIRIHSALGPGLFESVYEIVLARDLARRGFDVERQKLVSFEFERMHFDEGFKADLVVERTVVVEVKSVADLAPVFSKQLLTDLRLLDYRVGLILNFNTVHMKGGIRRIAN